MSAADLEAPAPDQGFVTKHSTSAPKVYTFKEDVPEDVSKHLSQQAEWAVKLLETLTKDNSEDGMPSGVLNACEGLAFINCAKGGFGVTWAKGDGFVIRKLESDRFAHSLWSAPVFFKVSQVGFGVAAGYERVDSALALMNIGSINRFAARQTLAGTDLGLFSTSAAVSGMPAGTFGGGQHLDIAADRETSVFAYSTSSGVLVNISINGTDVQPDTHWNDKLHGPGANLEAVLSGEGVTYKELLPLYRKVQELAQRALGQ